MHIFSSYSFNVFQLCTDNSRFVENPNTKNKSNNAILRLKCESYQLWMFSHFYRAEPGLKLFLWKSAESVERWNLGKECLKTEMSSEKECDATIHWTVSHTQSFKSAGKYQKCGWATTASKRDLQDLMFEQREIGFLWDGTPVFK